MTRAVVATAVVLGIAATSTARAQEAKPDHEWPRKERCECGRRLAPRWDFHLRIGPHWFDRRWLPDRLDLGRLPHLDRRWFDALPRGISPDEMPGWHHRWRIRVPERSWKWFGRSWHRLGRSRRYVTI